MPDNADPIPGSSPATPTDHGAPPRRFGPVTWLLTVLVVVGGGAAVAIYAIYSITAVPGSIAQAVFTPTPIQRTTSITSIIEESFRRSSLIVNEQRINERFVETWRAEPRWWRVVFGDFPGEATVTLDAPARVVYSVPLDADWTLSIDEAAGVASIVAPRPEVEAVELITENITANYNKKAWRFDEAEMEEKLRRELNTSMRARAQQRAETELMLREAEVAIESFVRDFVLQKLTDQPIRDVRVSFRPAADGGDRPLFDPAATDQPTGNK